MAQKQELVKHEQGELAMSSSNGDALLQIIASAVRDPQVDVAKMSALLDLKERVDAQQAKIEFNAAFSRLQMKLPRVTKNGTIDLGRGKPIPFAKWEDVDAVIRPILASEGFSLSFTCAPTTGHVEMTGHLRHLAGHEECSTMQLPPDAGPGRNALQAIGSSHSYGKRYIAVDMLNIITVGADDNATGAGFITQDQGDKIRDLMEACDLDAAGKSAFLEFMHVDQISQIQKYDYERGVQALQKKLLKVRAGR